MTDSAEIVPTWDPSDEYQEDPNPDRCVVCKGRIELLDSPSGSWWAHEVHPSDEHDAVPLSDASAEVVDRG